MGKSLSLYCHCLLLVKKVVLPFLFPMVPCLMAAYLAWVSWRLQLHHCVLCSSSAYNLVLLAFIMGSYRLRSRRQLSSSYLPVAPVSSPAVSSRDSSRDTNSRRSKGSKSRSDAANPKRRSTMNSRDAAYDEEEQLRRAIEESKEDTKSATEEAPASRGKRSRSDSDAYVNLSIVYFAKTSGLPPESKDADSNQL